MTYLSHQVTFLLNITDVRINITDVCHLISLQKWF